MPRSVTAIDFTKIYIGILYLKKIDITLL